MATTESVRVSREERRRRIAERGSDRLALITGRIQSLPSDTAQSPPAVAKLRNNADSSQHESFPPNPTLPEANQSPIQQDNLTKKTEESSHDHREKGNSIVSRAAALLDINKDLSQVLSSVENSVASTLDHQQSHRHSTITTAQISSMVSASEKIRLICSVLAGLLVAFSSANFPILGCNIVKNTLLLRPAYLLFLTNISIVLGRLTLETRGAGLKAWLTSSIPKFGGNDVVEQLGKALEIVMLLQKVLGGLFIDFCIYAIVLVCGMSLLKGFGL